jgi:RNA polymerase sigma-70 factor (ECF subfamily)
MEQRAQAPALPPDSESPSARTRRFDLTYREDRAFVLRVVRRLGIPSGDIEDAVQDVFIVLHARLPHLHHRAPLRPWLRSVAVRVCSNRRRSALLQRNRRQLRGDEALDPDSLFDLQQCAPDEAMAKAEQRDALVHALEQLDAAKRQVLVLTALEDRTASEIAGLIRTSPNTVSSRLRLARKSLVQALERPRGHTLRAAAAP